MNRCWHAPKQQSQHPRGPNFQRGYGIDITALAIVCVTHWLQQSAAQSALIRQATEGALSKRKLQCVLVQCLQPDVSTTHAGN